MKNKWIKLLFLGCVIGSFMSLTGQEAAAWSPGKLLQQAKAKAAALAKEKAQEAQQALECSSTYCDNKGYDSCVSFYSDVGTTVAAQPGCFAKVSENCANDCTSDANCTDINPSACPADQ